MKQSQRNDEQWRNWSDEWLSLKHSDNDSQYAPNFHQLLRKWDCKPNRNGGPRRVALHRLAQKV